MKKVMTLAATMACVFTVAAYAQAQKPASPASTGEHVMSAMVGSDTVTAKATVVKVDLKNRIVTLKEEDGTVEDVAVGEEVKNLPQIKAGDIVRVKYFESLAYTVRKPGGAAPAITVSEGVAAAKPGAKPGAVGAREVTVTATIMVIDAVHNTVTLKGPDGNLFKVLAQHPERLSVVNVGDQIDITYTQAVAISVEKAPK
jgi:hypothetical protein